VAVLALLLSVLAAPTATAAPTARHASCGAAPAGSARCLSTWQASGRAHGKVSARAAAAAGPAAGLRPIDIRTTYGLPTAGATTTVGIVDAYDNPKVEQDLATYRAAFGLPACTTANGCFRKVDQRGGKAYPEGDPGWGVEIALDVQAVSASCPTCKILLVEGDDPDLDSLGAAVNTAVRLGAKVVSNSYGTDEFAGMTAYAKKYYTHPGVPQLVSSGDYGFGPASFPAVLSNAWAVGGTTLTGSLSKGFTEKAWEGAGSGCSAYVDKPSRQTDTHCAMRTVADVSAVADAVDGFAVYDTYGLGADNGWIGVGGTSLSSPLLAGMIGMAGHPTTVASTTYLYGHRGGLKDVVGGSNGYCGGDYLCTGLKGYDAPTGLGSPRGLSSLGGAVTA
ncbi:MAG: S53 family peptidase, partial [Janthinobacterium lividum]